jgi:hypothetical protein
METAGQIKVFKMQSGLGNFLKGLFNPGFIEPGGQNPDLVESADLLDDIPSQDVFSGAEAGLSMGTAGKS